MNETAVLSLPVAVLLISYFFMTSYCPSRSLFPDRIAAAEAAAALGKAARLRARAGEEPHSARDPSGKRHPCDLALSTRQHTATTAAAFKATLIEHRDIPVAVAEGGMSDYE